jgi:hypothetical protein
MNTRLRVFERSLVLVLLAAPSFAAKAPPAGDIAPAAKRRTTVELAQKFATVAAPAPLAADSVLPFNPAAFNQPDPEEQRAFEQAAAKLRAQGEAPAGGSGQALPGATAREQLAAIASQIRPSGSMLVRGEPRLILQSRFVKTGDKFTVTYAGVDHVLELTAIDLTTFTLRLNGEAITRPIKSGSKSP